MDRRMQYLFSKPRRGFHFLGRHFTANRRRGRLAWEGLSAERRHESWGGPNKALGCAVFRVDENDVLRIALWRIDR
jgi:hypothetical protein